MNARQSTAEYLAELKEKEKVKEKERIAWVNGDTEKAALLAALIEARERISELERRLYGA